MLSFTKKRLVMLAILVIAVGVVFLIVRIERGQRRITVNYAKRQVGRQMVQGQSSHLPLKVNMAGVVPAIFASSILLFPASIAQWFGQSAQNMEWLQNDQGTSSSCTRNGYLNQRSPLCPFA